MDDKGRYELKSDEDTKKRWGGRVRKFQDHQLMYKRDGSQQGRYVIVGGR